MSAAACAPTPAARPATLCSLLLLAGASLVLPPAVKGWVCREDVLRVFC